MYIELFLLDNFVFDMLILYAASALCRMSYSKPAAYAVCAFCSVYSAFAVNISVLSSLPCKIALCALMSLPFYIKAHGFRIVPTLSVLFATICAGGLCFAASFGIMHRAPSYIRLFIYPAFLLSFLPSVLRRIQIRRAKSDIEAHIVFNLKKAEYSYDGIFDSGSGLCESFSGIPVIVIYAPLLTEFADIPIRYADTGSTGREIYAFYPDSLSVNGEPVQALIAPTRANPSMPALVPWVCREYIADKNTIGGDIYDRNTASSV